MEPVSVYNTMFDLCLTSVYSTIHGMVYNAMKLFMEINPQLFDDCSHDYNELQNNADQRESARKAKWDKLQQQADKMKTGLNGAKATKLKPEADATQDTQQRLGNFNLHDDTSKTTSVCSSPSTDSHG